MYTGPTEELVKRIYNGYGYHTRPRSRWYSYRWALIALLIIPLIFILVCFFLVRRRRSRRNIIMGPNQGYQGPPQGDQYGPPPGGQYGPPPGDQYGPPPGPPPQQFGNYPQTSQANYDANAGYNNYERPNSPPPTHQKY